MSWQISSPPLDQMAIIDFYSQSSFQADQVFADAQNSNFRDSYSESSYQADQVLADLPPQMAI